jgi:hypothetical protein
MSNRSSIYATSTGGLYEVTAATRIITDPGPKWEYTLRPVDLEYASGDVKPKATTSQTVTGYNVWELDNTTTTWFGLAYTAYAGLEFEPVPVGAVVMASAPASGMVTSTGLPDVTKSFWLLFQYPNQLSGTCS